VAAASAPSRAVIWAAACVVVGSGRVEKVWEMLCSGVEHKTTEHNPVVLRSDISQDLG
jgi:hypothetical protein